MKIRRFTDSEKLEITGIRALLVTAFAAHLILSIPTGYLLDQCPMGSRFLRSEEHGDGIQPGPSEGTWLRHLP
jgi:hypothetical protein